MLTGLRYRGNITRGLVLMTALIFPTFPAFAVTGSESGGGGDMYANEFRSIAKKLLYRFQMQNQYAPVGFSLTDFEKSIDPAQTRVTTVDVACIKRVPKGVGCAPDDIRDAVNFPEERQIEIGESRWARVRASQEDSELLVLHEYFGILKIEKDVMVRSTAELAGLRNFEANKSFNDSVLATWAAQSSAKALQSGAIKELEKGFSCTAASFAEHAGAGDRTVITNFEKKSDTVEHACALAIRACKEVTVERTGTYCLELRPESEEEQCSWRCRYIFEEEGNACSKLRLPTERASCLTDSGVLERMMACKVACQNDPKWFLVAKPVLAPAPSEPALPERCVAVMNAKLPALKVGQQVGLGTPLFEEMTRFLKWADCNNGEPTKYFLHEVGDYSMSSREISTNPAQLVPFDLLNVGHTPPIYHAYGGKWSYTKEVLVAGYGKLISANEFAIYAKWDRMTSKSANGPFKSRDNIHYMRYVLKFATSPRYPQPLIISLKTGTVERFPELGGLFHSNIGYEKILISEAYQNQSVLQKLRTSEKECKRLNDRMTDDVLKAFND